MTKPHTAAGQALLETEMRDRFVAAVSAGGYSLSEDDFAALIAKAEEEARAEGLETAEAVAAGLEELLDWADLHPLRNVEKIPPFRAVNLGIPDLERMRQLLARYDAARTGQGEA